MQVLPQSKGQFLLGDTVEVVRNPLHYILDRNRTMGDFYRVATVARKVVIASHPDIAKHILVDHNRDFKKSYDYEILKLVLGQGLLTSDGDFWLKQRRLAQPAFHRKRLDLLFGIMLDEAHQLRDRWKGFQQAGKPFELANEMITVTVNIVARALFGTHLGESIKAIGKNITILNTFISDRAKNPFLPPVWVPSRQNRAYRRASKEMDEIIYGIIQDRRKNPEGRDDLLAMLMEARDEETGEGMTDLQLRDEILTLFIAGHETSAISLCWTLILLSQNPEIRSKAQQEIREVIGEREITLEDIPKLAYIRRILDESLRLYPPAWVVGRKTLSDTDVAGFLVEKDVNIIISTYLIHRHPACWENPEAFDPDRFLPERSQDRHKYAYFPFGGGPRLCIGNNFALMEMTMLLAVILQSFTPEAQQAEWEPEPLVTLRPKGAVRFKV